MTELRRLRKPRRQPTFTDEDVIHYVYECINREGQVLYVGRSKDVTSRVNGHRRSEPWGAQIDRVVATGPMNWREVLAAERDRIVAAQPPHNREFITHNVPRAVIPIEYAD